MPAIGFHHGLPSRFSLAAGGLVHEPEDAGRGHEHTQKHKEQDQPSTTILPQSANSVRVLHSRLVYGRSVALTSICMPSCTALVEDNGQMPLKYTNVFSVRTHVSYSIIEALP